MKILKKALFLVTFSFLLSDFCIAQNAEEHFKRGKGYLETRLVNEAIAEFKKALHLFKEDQSELKAETYVSLANAYNWRGIHKAAITACKKAIEINPDFTNAHYNLGFAYREEGKEELAKKEFALYDKLLKQEGEYIEIPEKPTSEDIDKHITLGDNYFKEGKLDEAISEYKKALEIKPRDDILNKLGQVYQKKRLANKSEDQSRIDSFAGKNSKGEEIPLNPPLEKGEIGGFVGFSDEISQETSIDELSDRGISYYDKGMINEAIDEFKEVLEIDPEDVETHYNLGSAYADKGMFDEAITIYKKAIEKNPEFIDAYLSLGELYLDMDLIDDAISLYKQALNANPDDSFLCFYLGEAYARNKQYKEAIINYNNAISINPMDPETQYRLAEAYYKTKQYDMALEHATQAEELGYIAEPAFMVDLKKKTGTE
ncbi:MAG: O-linked GlcNAc transferase [Candidatus Scalindua rubra]|uniref:O-linked GlcNAc transferase n=1 Tax=Candidatus Scalindua rubra TaxID=1872076 RepID=A0A1E3XCP1_9BACT|nr:MAG: O-linked GlcNAc transferase [Candidatus Scalindua rubra]